VRLKANVIGPWGLAALVIGVRSPAIGLFAMWGPIEATAGPVVPLVFFGALAIILPTVLSYASLNRHAPSAGAAASWLWATVNPTTGLIAGLVMMTYFVMTAIIRSFARRKQKACACGGFPNATREKRQLPNCERPYQGRPGIYKAERRVPETRLTETQTESAPFTAPC